MLNLVQEPKSLGAGLCGLNLGGGTLRPSPRWDRRHSPSWLPCPRWNTKSKVNASPIPLLNAELPGRILAGGPRKSLTARSTMPVASSTPVNAPPRPPATSTYHAPPSTSGYKNSPARQRVPTKPVPSSLPRPSGRGDLSETFVSGTGCLATGGKSRLAEVVTSRKLWTASQKTAQHLAPAHALTGPIAAIYGRRGATDGLDVSPLAYRCSGRVHCRSRL